jgi:Amt family ammonium transporter
VYTFLISAIAWLLLKFTMGIRVSLQEEIGGLDIGEHGNSAYPDFVVRKTLPISAGAVAAGEPARR